MSRIGRKHRTVIVVFGGLGQVGQAIEEHCRPDDAPGIILMPRAYCDVTDPAKVRATVATTGKELVQGGWRPVFVNAAAITDVDACEGELYERAALVNADGAFFVAEACQREGYPLVHLSSDFVLEGWSESLPGQSGQVPRIPFELDLQPLPRGRYARTKAAGEREALRLGAVVLRIQSVYRLGSDAQGRPRSALGRLVEQAGQGADIRCTGLLSCPTPSAEVARAIVRLCERLAGPYPYMVPQLLHWATDGVATMGELVREACRIQGQPEPRIVPVQPEELHRAPRPRRSQLGTARSAGALDLDPVPWQQALREEVRRRIG